MSNTKYGLFSKAHMYVIIQNKVSNMLANHKVKSNRKNLQMRKIPGTV